MICTRCHEDDGLSQDFSHLPIDQVRGLCRDWRCQDCLREQDERAMQRLYDAEAAKTKHVSAHDWSAKATGSAA